jgi:tRNA U34 5-carboxymethylaminomethyl modifying GTPase MnmE/TrmE
MATRKMRSTSAAWHSDARPIVTALDLPEAVAACMEAERLAEAYDSHFVVANTGLLKAGKSTLFNALVGRVEQFPTGAARTTVRSQTVTLNGVLLVDTPGIDARAEDSEQALETLRGADLVLFVHNVGCGAYDAMELEQLRVLRGFFPDEASFRARVQPVLTLCDRHTEPDVASVMASTHAQTEQHLGFRLADPLPVAAERCLKGRAEGKEVLVHRSGIPALEGLLRARAESLLPGKAALHAARLEQLRGLVRSALTTANREVSAELQRVKQEADLRRTAWTKVQEDIGRHFQT